MRRKSPAAVRKLRRAAQAGDVQAQFELGHGMNSAEGVRWLRKAVDQGHLEAKNRLAECLEYGMGVRVDKAEALRLWREAAEAGIAGAQWRLGNHYEEGEGVPKDEVEAARWYRRAAEQGDVSASMSLAQMYASGRGVQRDDEEAIRWFQKAADSGDVWTKVDALVALGNLYARRQGVPGSVDEAVCLWRKAIDLSPSTLARSARLLGELDSLLYELPALIGEGKTLILWLHSAQKGRAWAQYALGEMYEKGRVPLCNPTLARMMEPEARQKLDDLQRLGVPKKDEAEAARWFRRAAEQGHEEAQFALAEMYREGRGVAQDDAEAVKWYRKAAMQGNSDAQRQLAEMYLTGRGAAKNPRAAVRWYRKAADDGSSEGQYNLGAIYYHGRGVVKDIIEAVRWWRKAASGGELDALYALGFLYGTGDGVAKDEVQARRWLRKAAAEGHEESKVLLQRLDGATGKTQVGPPGQSASASGTRGSKGFTGVAGMVDLKNLLLEEVVRPARDPESFLQYGIPVPNGILVYGPPGCGKTYIARHLAEEMGWFFKEVRGSDIGNIYVHGSTLAIRALFDEAVAHAPAMIFIDEFEGLVPKRSDLPGNFQFKPEEVNEFLVHLDGCSSRKVFVVAATNEPDKIDPAILRPGRIDKLIYVGPPDLAARKELLMMYLAHRPTAGIRMDVLAKRLQGYSCVDIQHITNEAARLALKQNKRIGTEHLEAAISRNPSSLSPAIIERYKHVQQRGI